MEVYHQAWMGEALTWHDGDGGDVGDPRGGYGRGLYSSTFQLNLSRSWNKSPP